MYSFSEFIQQWITRAESDVLSAKILIEHNPMVLDNACFHCQQAIEKYLKAFLVFKEIDIIKTHDIDFLKEECSKLDIEFLDIDFKNLGVYAVKFRYPHDAEMPTLKEANEYFEMALEVKNMVHKKLKKL